MSGTKTGRAMGTYTQPQARPPSHVSRRPALLEDVLMPRRLLALLASLALAALLATPVVATSPSAVNAFHVTVLQSDASDANLVNGWGIVSGPTTPWWVVNNGTDTSTLYNAAGAKVALTVAVAGEPT